MRRPNGTQQAVRLTVAGMLLCGCTAVSTASPSAQQSATSAQSVEPSPTATQPSLPSPSDSRVEWQLGGTFGPGTAWDRVIGVAHGGAGFVAIGNRLVAASEVGYNPGGDFLWASTDGRTWDDIQLPDQLDGASPQALTTTQDGAFVLFANRNSGDVYVPVVLTSADGRSGWTVVDSGLPQSLLIGKVVRGAAGYLLLEPQTAGRDAVLWFSTDGLRWQQTHRFAQEEHWVQVSDIGAGDEGFVAVGVQIELNSTWARFTLASGDGRTWYETREPFGTGDPGYRPDVFLAPIGPDWIAAVAGQDSSTHIWLSSNGLDWRPGTNIEGIQADQGWEPALFTLGDEVYLSPFATDFPAPLLQAPTWTSSDGVSWSKLRIDASAAVRTGADGPDATVLAGVNVLQDGHSRASFWYRPAL